MTLRQRKSERYSLSRPVDVTLNHERVAFGTLVDVSRDGFGFKTHQQLRLGETYQIEIRGIGTFTSKIVNASLGRYGGVFQISETRKSQLELRIKEAFKPS